MPDKTPRLDLDTYEEGEESWSHTDTVEAVDEYAIDRGPIEDRPDTGEYDDELYHATDQRITWRWDVDDGDWKPIGGMGSEGSPLPGTAYRESLEAEEVAPTDTDSQKQVVIKGLDSSNELQDIDGGTQDKGVFIDRSQAAKDNGENIRLILGENVVLGWHNGTDATELIKTYNDTVNIENDRADKGIALESRRGGNVALKTSEGTGAANKLARVVVDDNQSPETTVTFQNLNEMMMEGDAIKFRQDNSVASTFEIKPQNSNEANTSTTRTILDTDGFFDFRVNGATYFDIQDNQVNVCENLKLNGNPLEDIRVESSVPSTVRQGEVVVGDGTGGSGEDEMFISADGSTISRITADATV